MNEVRRYKIDGTAGELRRALAGVPDDAVVRGKGATLAIADAMDPDGATLRSVAFELPETGEGNGS